MEHTAKITLSGYSHPEVTYGQAPLMQRGMDGVDNSALAVWRDDDNNGEILVSRSWKYHAGQSAKDNAMSIADAASGRSINWQFAEFDAAEHGGS